MADIKLSIINSALTVAGEEMLTDLTPGSVMADAAICNYDQIVNEEIENGAWKFASTTTDTTATTLLTAQSAAPLQYQWQIPAEATEVLSVLYKGYDLDGENYQIEGPVVRCRYNTDITIKFEKRPDESVWPYRFRGIIIGRLKALFMAVSERHAEAEAVEERTDKKAKIAKHTEARQQRNRPLGDGTLVDARLGRRRRRSS